MIQAFVTLMVMSAFARASSPVILYTNDVFAELEPCGCRKDPEGGMVRREVFIERLKKSGVKEILQFDSGDFLFGSKVIPEALRAQAEVQAKTVVEALNRLGQTAATVGEMDFALGLEKFYSLTSAARFEFLVANLEDPGKPNPPFKDHQIYSVKSSSGEALKLGVFGVVDPELEWPDSFKKKPLIETAKAQTDELRKQGCTLIIALTHQGIEKDRALAEAVSGIDIILGSHTQSYLQEPEKIGKTFIFQSSYRNQHIGKIPLQLPFEATNHELVGLDASYEPVKSGAMTKLVADFKKQIAHLGKTSPKKSAAVTAYQTFPHCAECHREQFNFWKNTPHANSLLPLHAKDMIWNKECLVCHSLGLGEPGGFEDLQNAVLFNPGEDGTEMGLSVEEAENWMKELQKDANPSAKLAKVFKAWVPVQCENCHQMSETHPQKKAKKAVATELQCVRCHTPERAPDWYQKGQLRTAFVAEKRKSVSCPRIKKP